MMIIYLTFVQPNELLVVRIIRFFVAENIMMLSSLLGSFLPNMFYANTCSEKRTECFVQS